MVDFGKLTDKAKELADDNRDRLEDLAEKGVAKYEERTGKEAPGKVDELVDKIDPDDDEPVTETETDEVLSRPGATGGAGTRPTDVSGENLLREVHRNA